MRETVTVDDELDAKVRAEIESRYPGVKVTFSSVVESALRDWLVKKT